jgi:peptidoglycan hydrolase-like protein with peptidoglycan-binding domain
LSREARENRQQIYEESAQALALLPFEKRIKLQERLTLNHLSNAGIDIPVLKELLNKLGYYQGVTDQFFSPGLVQAIEKFQTDNIPGQSDGIVGPVTLAKISEMLHP